MTLNLYSDLILQAANARSAAKDRDMSELMKGLSDIQKSGQGREEELKAQKVRDQHFCLV